MVMKLIPKLAGILLVVFLIVLAGCSTNEKALIDAVKNGDTAKVQSLLAKGVSPNLKTDDGKTVLMLAAYLGKTDVARLLIDKGADVNGKDDSEKTALMYAAEKGNLEIVKLLLEKGADINVVDKNGKTALNFAEENNQKETADYLRNWNKSASDKPATDQPVSGPTPKVTQTQATPAPAVKPTPINEAFLAAVQEGNIDKVKELLNKGANVDAKNNHGKTALMFAAENGNFPLVKLLVENGAEILAKDNSGKTAIKYALDNKHNEIATYLMQKAGLRK